MPTLELAIDATKAQQGAAAFENATKSIESATASTQARLALLDQVMATAASSTQELSNSTVKLGNTTKLIETSAQSAQQKLAMYEKSMASTFESTKSLSAASEKLHQATQTTEALLSTVNARLKTVDASFNAASASSAQMGTTYVASARSIDAANAASASRMAMATRAMATAAGAAGGVARAGGAAAGGLALMSAAIPGANLIMFGSILMSVVTGIISMDDAADKAARKVDVFALSLEQVQAAGREAADAVYDMRRAIEMNSLKDQSDALSSYSRAIEQADKAIMKMRGPQSGKFRVVNANDYRELFQFSDAAQERFKQLFVESQEVTTRGKREIVKILNEDAFNDTKKGAYFGISAISVQEALRDVMGVVKEEKQKIDDELKRERDADRKPIVATIKSEYKPQVLDDLKRELDLVKKFGDNQEELNRQRDISNAMSKAQSEAERAYSDNFKLQAFYILASVDAAYKLADARRDLANAAKAEQDAKNDRVAKQTLEALQSELDLALKFAGNKDGFVEARERIRESTQAQADAERLYGDNVQKTSEYVRDYMKLYDQLVSARKNLELPKPEKPEKIKIDEKERIRIRRQESATEDFNDLFDKMKTERDLIFLTNNEREIQLQLRQAQKLADQGEIADKETKLKLYEREIRSMQNFKELQRIASGVGESFGSAFEDVIMGAKSADDAIQDLYRSIARLVINQMVTQPFAQAISSGLGSILSDFVSGGAGTGGSTFGGGRATGGQVFANKWYDVGERGPERLYMNGDGTGYVEPSGNRSNNDRGSVVHLHITTQDADSFRRSKSQIRNMLKGL